VAIVDAADRAQIREEQEREAALARVIEAARKCGAVYQECQECADEIPQGRQGPGVDLCIDCQELRERGLL
jgi:RNA polymerase-binding transcription factor DksA